jgi:hypothetical protein
MADGFNSVFKGLNGTNNILYINIVFYERTNLRNIKLELYICQPCSVIKYYALSKNN